MSASTPTIFYRGEHGVSRKRIHTRLPSISFGSRRAAERYALHPNHSGDVIHSPRVMAAHLTIRHPVVNQPNDPFIEFVDLEMRFGPVTLIDLLIRHFDHIRQTNAWESMGRDDTVSWDRIIAQLCCQIYLLLDDHWFIEICVSHGYDGALYRGSGETRDEVEARVFKVEQITVIREYML